MHRRAAKLLRDESGSPDGIAAHLLASVPAGDPFAVEVLVKAGERASQIRMARHERSDQRLVAELARDGERHLGRAQLHQPREHLVVPELPRDEVRRFVGA